MRPKPTQGCPESVYAMWPKMVSAEWDFCQWLGEALCSLIDKQENGFFCKLEWVGCLWRRNLSSGNGSISRGFLWFWFCFCFILFVFFPMSLLKLPVRKFQHCPGWTIRKPKSSTPRARVAKGWLPRGLYCGSGELMKTNEKSKRQNLRPTTK